MFKVKQKISKVLLACLTALFAVVLAIGGIFAMPNTTVHAADKEIAFNLGANGSASHNDGTSKTTYSETVDGYTLNITGGNKMYTGARDAKGNSCIKLGTSSAVGGFSFTVPEEVTSVIIAVGKYKTNASKVTINGTTHTLTKSSNDGVYDAVTVDTSSTKNVKLATASGAVRAMVNTITFVIPAPEGACEHVSKTPVETVDATCEATGKITYTCDSCGEKVVETIPALGHNKKEEITEATCTTAGSKTITCSRCDFNETVEIPVIPHNYVDGICVDCGAVQPDEATASKTVKDLIVSEGWTSNTTKQSFNLDDVVSVKVNGGNNTGKAYDGDHIRIYATDSPAGTLTISVADGYELVSVKVSTKTDDTYAFLYVDGNTTNICNVATPVSGSSVVLKSVKNGNDGKQVRVTAIEVEYKVFKAQNEVNAINSYMNLSYAYSTDTVETDGVEEEIMLSSKFVIRCGIDASIPTVNGVESFGIRVSAGGKTVDYNEDTANSWALDEENNVYYVVINLGDIINDTTKLTTEFTVQAYVVYMGETYISESIKTHSVVSMVKAYKETGENVEHLYNYLVSKGLIVEG